MWTTMTVEDPFSDKQIKIALDKHCPQVKAQAESLAKLAEKIKQQNSVQLEELDKNLRNVFSCGSKRVREVLDGLNQASEDIN